MHPFLHLLLCGVVECYCFYQSAETLNWYELLKLHENKWTLEYFFVFGARLKKFARLFVYFAILRKIGKIKTFWDYIIKKYLNSEITNIFLLLFHFWKFNFPKCCMLGSSDIYLIIDKWLLARLWISIQSPSLQQICCRVLNYLLCFLL